MEDLVWFCLLATLVLLFTPSGYYFRNSEKMNKLVSLFPPITLLAVIFYSAFKKRQQSNKGMQFDSEGGFCCQGTPKIEQETRQKLYKLLMEGEFLC